MYSLSVNNYGQIRFFLYFSSRMFTDSFIRVHMGDLRLQEEKPHEVFDTMSVYLIRAENDSKQKLTVFKKSNEVAHLDFSKPTEGLSASLLCLIYSAYLLISSSSSFANCRWRCPWEVHCRPMHLLPSTRGCLLPLPSHHCRCLSSDPSRGPILPRSQGKTLEFLFSHSRFVNWRV